MDGYPYGTSGLCTDDPPPTSMSGTGVNTLTGLETGLSWVPGFHDDGQGNCTYGYGELMAKERSCSYLASIGHAKYSMIAQATSMLTIDEKEEYAYNRFRKFVLPDYEIAVHSALLETDPTPKQFDALVLFAYNHGSSIYGENNSGKLIIEYLIQGKIEAAAAFITTYDEDNPVLELRNMETAILLIGGPYRASKIAFYSSGCIDANCLMNIYLGNNETFLSEKNSYK